MSFVKKITPKKVETVILNILTLIILNLIYWLCNLYPKHILEFNSWQSILALFWNLIYHGIYFFFLAICFIENESFFSSKVYSISTKALKDRFHIRELCQLLILQLFIDLLNYGSALFFDKYSVLLVAVITIIKWLLTYFILQKHQEISIYKKSILKIAVCVFLLAILLINTFFMLGNIVEIEALTKKFVSDSSILTQNLKNITYIAQFWNLILDTVLGVFLYSLHIVSRKNSKRANSNKHSTGLFRLLLRVSALGVFLTFMFVLKLIISPNNLIVTTNIHDSYHLYQPETFYVESQELKSVRKIGYDSTNCVYGEIKYKVFYGKNKLTEFNVAHTYEDSNLIQNGNTIIIDNGYKKYNVNNQENIVYHNNVICYYDNQKPTAVIYENIKNQPKNDTLIKICEEMIHEGNMVAFDYSYEYINQHDPEFIIPYAERYAKQTFNDNEIKYIDDYGYNKEYIASIARTIL